jgi:hypothetical protein
MRDYILVENGVSTQPISPIWIIQIFVNEVVTSLWDLDSILHLISTKLMSLTGLRNDYFC